MYELNTLKLRTNKPLKNKLIQIIITNPITSIFKGAILHNIKYKRKLSLLKIACVLRNANKNNTKIKRLNFLLHRDLGNPGNIKLIEQDKIVILDFASFGIQKKWILGDLIDISFSLESIQMNLKFYNTYVNKMKLDYPDIYNNLNFNNQVRIALLRKTINFLVYSNHSYPKLYSFIDKVLLVDEKYETWYKQIFQN